MSDVPKEEQRFKPKFFVLDTNVLMHDPASLFSFEEHDIVVPMSVLEELDNHKKGPKSADHNARQATRFLDEIMGKASQSVDGFSVFPLLTKQLRSRGMLFVETQHVRPIEVHPSLDPEKPDNHILALVLYIQGMRGDREVVLVSNDINMRVKARAVGLIAQDYKSDVVVEDIDFLPTGVHNLKENFWKRAAQKDLQSERVEGKNIYRIHAKFGRKWCPNDFIFIDGAVPFNARVRGITGEQVELVEVDNYCSLKNAVMQITARNREQNYALNLLNDTDVDFVTLIGMAGCGKTLLTLASAFHQVIQKEAYSGIVLTRATVPIGQDIGYLPGDEEEKMGPWMGALDDNVEVINEAIASARMTNLLLTKEALKKYVKIKSLSFMRGRSFNAKFVIIDEAQNLTRKEIKTLVTRAGPGTKVVCLGNLAQTDTPYLNPESSGLAHVVASFQNYRHGGHVLLKEGVRSRLAKYAEEEL